LPWTVKSSTVPAKDAPHLDLNLQVGIGQINVVRMANDGAATAQK
jgi:hypothetical protein